MTMASDMTTSTSGISRRDSILVDDLATLLSCALNASGSSVSQPLKNSATKLQQLFLSPPVQHGPAEETCFWLPGLSLKQQQQQQHQGLPNHAKSNKHMLQDAAAQHLSSQLHVSHSELPHVPMKLLWNLSKSFLQLVDARLRSSVLALIQQSAPDGTRSNLLQSPAIKCLLSSKYAPPISPTTIITTFKTVTQQAERVEDNVYIAPLFVEAVIDVNVLGVLQTVKIGAPGTVTCAIGVAMNKLVCAEIKFDTAVLLQSMMREARLLVKQAIARAFGIYQPQQQQQYLSFFQHQQQLLGDLGHRPEDRDNQYMDDTQHNNDDMQNSAFAGDHNNEEENHNTMPPPQPIATFSTQEQHQQTLINNNNHNQMSYINETILSSPQHISNHYNVGNMMMGDYDFSDNQNRQHQQLLQAQQLQQMMMMQQQYDDDDLYQQHQLQEQRQQQQIYGQQQQQLMYGHPPVKQEMDDPQFYPSMSQDEEMGHPGDGNPSQLDQLTAALAAVKQEQSSENDSYVSKNAQAALI